MTQSEGSQLLQSISDAVAQLADKVAPSVVSVNSGRRAGTGLVWSGDGYIVTADHVVGRSEAPTVKLGDGRELEAKVAGRDSYADVALLKVDADGLAPIRATDGHDPRVGQFALAMARAFGQKPSATSGIITSQGVSMRGYWGVRIQDAVVTDAKLNPGYSGGPLVDASGNLLGMNVAYFSGRGIAISTPTLREAVETLSRDGGARMGHLGVVIEPIELPEELASRPEIGQEQGLLVRAVEARSPARTAGVALGDVIIKFAGTDATDEYELHKALQGDAVGRSASLRVLRGEKLTELTITPEEAEE